LPLLINPFGGHILQGIPIAFSGLGWQ